MAKIDFRSWIENQIIFGGLAGQNGSKMVIFGRSLGSFLTVQTPEEKTDFGQIFQGKFDTHRALGKRGLGWGR